MDKEKKARGTQEVGVGTSMFLSYLRGKGVSVQQAAIESAALAKENYILCPDNFFFYKKVGEYGIIVLIPLNQSMGNSPFFAFIVDLDEETGIVSIGISDDTGEKEDHELKFAYDDPVLIPILNFLGIAISFVAGVPTGLIIDFVDGVTK